ncbi:MAG: hypothetical protein ACOVN2_12500 [Usitatibacteraceae bacterium]
MQSTFNTPRAGRKVSLFLAAALVVTSLGAAGLASLYGARPIDPSALLSAEHLPLVVTATRLKSGGIQIAQHLGREQSAARGCSSIAC